MPRSQVNLCKGRLPKLVSQEPLGEGRKRFCCGDLGGDILERDPPGSHTDRRIDPKLIAWTHAPHDREALRAKSYQLRTGELWRLPGHRGREWESPRIPAIGRVTAVRFASLTRARFSWDFLSLLNQ